MLDILLGRKLEDLSEYAKQHSDFLQLAPIAVVMDFGTQTSSELMRMASSGKGGRCLLQRTLGQALLGKYVHVDKEGLKSLKILRFPFVQQSLNRFFNCREYQFRSLG